MLNFKYFISLFMESSYKIINLGIKLFQDGKDSNVYVSYRVV